MNFMIDEMTDEDWNDVASIYREGVATGNATFETTVPSWEQWDKSRLKNCRLVAKAEGDVIGWAALSPVSTRCVYTGVAEISLYVAASTRGVGVGKALLRALIEESERAGIWTLQAGIFPENAASIALTRGCGFREVGRRERLGQMDGIWRDVILMERRSNGVGVEERGDIRMFDNAGNKVHYFPRGSLKLESDVQGAKMWGVSLDKTMLTYFEVEPHCRFEKHHHESEQITFVLEGELFFEVPEETICVKQGEVIAIGSNIPHAAFTTDNAVKAVDAWSPVMEKYK